MFLDGYLALGSPTGPGTFTEMAAAGYARQPISFSEPIYGATYSSRAYNFGQTIRGFSGRAIYDAPSGGNLLLVLPFPTPLGARLPWDFGDQNYLRLVFTALIPYAAGATYSGAIGAAAVVGTANDRADIVNAVGLAPGSGAYSGTPVPVINTAILTAGVGLTIARGILSKT